MPDTMQPASDAAEQTMPGKPDLDQLPREPLMRVVTKGWWTVREELVPREVLEAANRDAQKKKARRFSLK